MSLPTDRPGPARHPDPTQPPGPAAPAPPPGPPPPSRPPDPPGTPGTSPQPLAPEDVLLAQRTVLVAGSLDHATADSAVARLLLLDADGPDPVELHLRCPDGDLDAAATLADAIVTAHVPVRAVVGAAGGAVVGVLAVADERVATRSCLITVTEPLVTARPTGAADLDLVARRVERLRTQLRRRLSVATGRPLEEVTRDLRRGLVLSGAEALEYGLVSSLR